MKINEMGGNGLPEESKKALVCEAQTEDSENTSDVQEEAKKKLEDELKNAKNKLFAAPVIKYLLGRCEGNKGLSEDILQRHKTWEKCLDYIYSLARKQATRNCAVIRDEVVYEWAEDYYHKDDKAEERAARAKENMGNPKTENKVAQEKQKSSVLADKAEKKQIRRNDTDLEGQMDMFSMMGM